VLTETSGTSRAPSLGIPATPLCQLGFAKKTLAPPPPANMVPVPQTEPVQFAFHTSSGIYDTADSNAVPFEETQYVPPVSLNCVPPTATVYGDDARTFTESARVDDVSVFGSSHPAEPESPDETT